MAEKNEVKELDQVVLRFSGDSGDGIQFLADHYVTGECPHCHNQNA